MSHRHTYETPANTAIPVDPSPATFCGPVQNGTGTRDQQWHKSDTACSSDVPAETANETPGALAGAAGVDVQTKAVNADHTAADPASATPMCANCRWALRYRDDEPQRHASHGHLDLEHPAFVRMCWLHSGRGEAFVQLVNTFWSCGQWEGRA